MTDTHTPIAPQIPEAALAVLGHNSGTLLYSAIDGLEIRLAGFDEALTASTAPSVRDLMKNAHDQAGELEADRMAAQQPYQDEIDKVRAAYRPLVDRALAVKASARKLLDRFLAAEDLRIKQEARDAEQRLEQQRQAAREALEAAQASPFAQGEADDAQKVLAELEIDAAHAARKAEGGPSVSSASGLARAAGYRISYSVNVTDSAKLVKHFAKHPDVIAAAEKLANAAARASKGAMRIPGCAMVENRSAA
jgi:hypothetical protein